jgi:hypothetical protein
VTDRDPIEAECPDCEYEGPFMGISTDGIPGIDADAVRCPNCKRAYPRTRLLGQSSEFFERQRRSVRTDGDGDPPDASTTAFPAIADDHGPEPVARDPARLLERALDAIDAESVHARRHVQAALLFLESPDAGVDEYLTRALDAAEDDVVKDRIRRVITRRSALRRDGGDA